MLVSAARGAADYLWKSLPRPISALTGIAARAIGFDMPTDLRAPEIAVVRYAPTFSFSSGLDTSQLLARNPAQKLAVSPGLTPGYDEDDLASLASIPSLLEHGYTWRASNDVGFRIFSLPLNPKYCSYQNTPRADEHEPTIASKVTLPFSYWRGTLRYWIYISGPALYKSRVKLSVRYATDVAAAPLPITDGDSPSKIFEVQGCGVIAVSVPFCFPQPFAAESIGRLEMQLLNPPLPAGDNVNANVNLAVYFSCAPDLELYGQSGEYYIPVDCGSGPPPEALMAEAVPEYDPRSEPPGAPIGADYTVAIPDATYAPVRMRRLSELLRCPELFSSRITGGITLPTSLTLTPRVVTSMFGWIASVRPFSYSLPTLANGFMPPSTFPMVPTSNPTDVALQRIINNNFIGYGALDHFADLFRFQRGGLRTKFYITDGRYIRAHVPPMSTLSAGIPLLTNGMTGGGQRPFLPSSEDTDTISTCQPGALLFPSNQWAELEVPFRSRMLYIPTRDLSLARGVWADASSPSGEHVVQLRATNGTEIVSEIWRSAADDFRFHYVCGPRRSYRVRLRASGTSSVGGRSLVLSVANSADHDGVVYW